jgi:DNA anti-recombination protein RmuC
MFSKELGEIKEAARTVEIMRENMLRSFKDQDVRLKPIDEGMTHLLDYFGTLKKNAGKVGELTFDLLVEQLPPGKLLKNITFDNQARLEFLIEAGGEWVPVDSKFSKNPRVYFKKAVEDVSSKYLGKKVLTVKDNPSSIDTSEIESASFGLVFFPSDEALFEVYRSDELRQLMIEKRVWAVSPSNFYWQLFYFKWMEDQAEKVKNSSSILKSMNMGLMEVNKTVESLDLVEKQLRQCLSNFEKSKKSLKKVSTHFIKEHI